jgi:hypothetical protein
MMLKRCAFGEFSPSPSEKPIHLASEDPKQQAQKNAENNACDDRKIKHRMLAFYPDVTGQSTQPFRRDPAPHHEPYQRDDHANDGHKFAQLAHHSKVA